jgi:uncharacterized protein (DUF924 family)
MDMIGPEEVLGFWLDEVGPEGWFKTDEALDAQIRDRFEDAWDSVMSGTYSLWLTYPSGTLAYVILTDQFSRNMFRGTAKAFASDRVALAAAKSAVDKGWDLKIEEPARVHFYLPMEHSENLCNQDRCVRLTHERMPNTGAEYLAHARAHREVIRRFGRFPSRNKALSRQTTAAEEAFLSNGGYGAILREMDLQKAS